MPELPDLEVYRAALAARICGRRILAIELRNPFVLRTALPPIDEAIGRTVREIRRLHKRIIFALDGDLFLVMHLMIAGRLLWLTGTKKAPGRITLATFAFDNGTLVLTEAGTKRRASLHLVQGILGVSQFDTG